MFGPTYALMATPDAVVDAAKLGTGVAEATMREGLDKVAPILQDIVRASTGFNTLAGLVAPFAPKAKTSVAPGATSTGAVVTESAAETAAAPSAPTKPVVTVVEQRAAPGSARAAAPGPVAQSAQSGPVWLETSSLRYSQRTAGGSGRADVLRSEMSGGWDPSKGSIDVVQTTRVLPLRVNSGSIKSQAECTR
jgi:hypothetical protein